MDYSGELHDTMCCGGGELEGFNNEDFTPKRLLAAYGFGCGWTDADHDLNDKEARSWIVFSYAADVGKTGKGHRTRIQGAARLRAWKAFIEKNGFGPVFITSVWKPNPNHGNKSELRAGVWQPNNKKVLAYLRKNYLLRQESSWRYF